MAIAALQRILDDIDTWPEEVQEEAVALLAPLQPGRDDEALQVSDNDMAEIARRLADPNIRRLSVDEFNARMDRLTRR